MNNFPIFLVPTGRKMMTAKITDNKISLLAESPFPMGCRYAISKDGLAACLDREKELILYGQLNAQGKLDGLKELPFPEMITPKAICLIGEHIVLGGTHPVKRLADNVFVRESRPFELVATYSIKQDRFTAVEMPYKGAGKAVDDLLQMGDTVIAVDNCVSPKYIIEYNFQNPEAPFLAKAHKLAYNGPYESIKKGTLNQHYMALLSYSVGRNGEFVHINIFRHGDYEQGISLSQRIHSGLDKRDPALDPPHYWRDILMLPDKNILLIASHNTGVGVYLIDDKKISTKRNADDASSVQYINNWPDNTIKLIMAPHDNDKLIIIFKKYDFEMRRDTYSYGWERSDKRQGDCSHALESIQDLLQRAN